MQIRPVMQILAIAAIVLGLTASAAWAGFLGFELLRMIRNALRPGLIDFGSAGFN